MWGKKPTGFDNALDMRQRESSRVTPRLQFVQLDWLRCDLLSEGSLKKRPKIMSKGGLELGRTLDDVQGIARGRAADKATEV